MSLKAILEDDWSDYDNKKVTGKADSKDFACTESWEVNYLGGKIRKHHPEINEYSIRVAIVTCSRVLKAPHPREKFVGCVAAGLDIPMT